MSSINNGEEDNHNSDNEEENSNEKHSSQNNDKVEEKESFKDSVNNLKGSSDDTLSKDSIFKMKGDGIAHVDMIIQTVHTLERDQETRINLADSVSDPTRSSSSSIENIDKVFSNHDQVKISPRVETNKMLVANPISMVEARPMSGKEIERIETGTQGSLRDMFHRKDYQVMLYWRGVGGAVGTVGTMMRLGKVVRASGVKPGCVLNRLSHMLPGRCGHCRENCNAYVTYVMFLLFMMLLATAYCLNYCLTRPRSRFYYYRYWWQIILSCLTAILFLNYLMFSYMMERYMALNYICLILAVVACSMFVSAISARLENDALWIANAMTAATVLFLFLLSFAQVDFSHRMLCLIAVLFSLFALLCLIYMNRLYSFYNSPYSSQVLYVSGFLGALRVFFMVIELQRLLCSCVASGCCDHAFGAFILYTLYLQFIFFLFQWFPLRRNC